MELRHLRYFLAVARHRNFTRAAESLNIAQPPLSQQIQQLEREIGALLFDRSGRQLALTLEGEVLLKHAQEIFAIINDMQTEVSEINQGNLGAVALGVNSSAATLLVPQIVQILYQRIPRVELSIREGGTTTIMDMVLNRQIDLGLVRMPLPVEHAHVDELEYRILYQEQTIVVVPRSHRFALRKDGVSVRDLAEEALLLARSDQGSFHDMIIRACHAEGFNPHIACEGAEISTLVRLAAAGVGVSIVPERGMMLVPDIHDQIVGIPLLADSLVTSVGVIWRKGRYRSKVSLVLEHIIDEVVSGIQTVTISSA